MDELISNLKLRNMNGYFVKDKNQALSKVIELIPPNSVIGFGGSVTLEQIGILDHLRKKEEVELLDRTIFADSQLIYNLYKNVFGRCFSFERERNYIGR